MEKAKVAVFIGSASDEATVAPCADILKKLGIPFRFTVTSAHRTPERTAELVDSLEAAGCEVFICAAGMAAHLAGAVAARTMKPVIGIPVVASPLGGIRAARWTAWTPCWPPCRCLPDSPSPPSPSTRPGPGTPLGWPPRSSRFTIPSLPIRSVFPASGSSPTSPSPGLRSKPSTVKFRKKSYGEGGSL